MTPSQLKNWRQRLGWSHDVAAEQLGLSRRAYLYLETGVTSGGALRTQVPRYIALATAELESQADRIKIKRPLP